MSFDDAPVTVRVPLPYDLPRGRAHTITAPLYRDGAAVSATDATCTIYNESGTAVVPTASTTIPSGVPTLALDSDDLDGQSYGSGWRVEWSITHAGGVIDSRHEAALVRSALSPVITDDDLYRRHKGLDPDAPAGQSLSVREDYQDSLDEAWVEIMLRLYSIGRRPYLVMSPSALRECHLYLTLSLIFDDLATGSGLQYMETATRYRQQFESAWGRLSLVYDADDDGEVDAGGRVGPPAIWLMGRT